MVAERQVPMREIANGLDARPTRTHIAEQAPRVRHQRFCFAIPAAEQIDERIRGQYADRLFPCMGKSSLRQPGIPDDSIGGKFDLAGGRYHTGTGISKGILIDARGHIRIHVHCVGHDQISRSTRMHFEHQHHRRRLRARINQFVAEAYVHVLSLEKGPLTPCGVAFPHKDCPRGRVLESASQYPDRKSDATDNRRPPRARTRSRPRPPRPWRPARIPDWGRASARLRRASSLYAVRSSRLDRGRSVRRRNSGLADGRNRIR